MTKSETFTRKLAAKKRIALIAHDNKKPELIEWAIYNKTVLAEHELYGTGTTGRLLAEALDQPVTRLLSGPLGGDQQIGAMIAEHRIDVMIFFWDPMEAQPHDPDIKALLRLGVVWNIPFACDRASADFLMTSPLMHQEYEVRLPDYGAYLGRKVKQYISIFLFLSLFISCQTQLELTDSELTTKWADMTLFITKNTPGNSPTYSSRCLGYIGLTMYEAVVQGTPQYNSLSAQLDSFYSLPKPKDGQSYDWRLSLNAAEAYILKNIYNQTSDENKAKIDSLETAINQYYGKKITDKATIGRSVAFGKEVATTVFDWSKTDGGHRAYLKNFDKKMVHPSKAGSWKPPLYGQSFSHYPLHPHWGEKRTFVKKNAEISDPLLIPYDTMPNSPYYQQFLAVYNQEKVLTQDQKEAAIWWSDDPDETFTPPGHSYYLATLVIKKTQPDLIKCAETYAKVGMAVADAFRNCWKWKYKFFTERPNTFITEHIDERWESFWPDPPFPSFPSGHAIQASATATVLTGLYGEKFEFTDDAHEGRKRDELRETEFKSRHYNSFWEVADETAKSRFYGGIHVPQDNEAGLVKGKEIANNINQLQWKK